MAVFKDKIDGLRRDALKASQGDEDQKLRLDVYRGLYGALIEAETDGKTRRELTEQDEIAVLRSEAKKREKSSQIYADAGAADRAQREADEAAVVRELLPAEADDTALRSAIESILSERPDLQGAGGKAIGQVMGALKKSGLSFDPAAASQIIKGLV